MKQTNDIKENGTFKIHLIYIVIIFILTILGLLSLIFVKSTTAIGTLAYASTLLSIVLAVIAILITLWDVSGQKQNVYEVMKQTEELKKLVDEEKISKQQTKEVLESLKKLQAQLQMNVSIQEKALDLLQDIKTKKSIDEEDNKKIDSLVEEKNNNYDNLLKLANNYPKFSPDMLKAVNNINKFYSNRINSKEN